jgi:6-pyruvoyltetrahydropterin/6-carboxytetrahydropterin synthase
MNRNIKNKFFLTKRFEFCSSHRYYKKEWSKEKNEKFFGNSISEHGHNFILEVTVGGKVNKDTGMILNTYSLKEIVNNVLLEFDHKFLNEDTHYFKNITPTPENLSVVFWNIIKKKLPKNCFLKRIRIYETQDLYVDYYGES